MSETKFDKEDPPGYFVCPSCSDNIAVDANEKRRCPNCGYILEGDTDEFVECTDDDCD